jgi:isocitrate dehydrogenase kinase/phosphatase
MSETVARSTPWWSVLGASGAALSDVETSGIAREVLADVPLVRDRQAKAEAIAAAILAVFDHYYWRSRRIPHAAKRAFEQRNWPEIPILSHDRLVIYRACLEAFVTALRAVWPRVADEGSFWVEIEAVVLDRIRGRYEADLAFAWLRSVRRAVSAGEWTPVAYAGSGIRSSRPPDDSAVARVFGCEDTVDTDTALALLEIGRFEAPFRDLPGDARLLARAIDDALQAAAAGDVGEIAIRMIDAGFFRNRGCYLIGRVQFARGALPLGLALLNEPGGIFLDAVLLSSEDLQFVFSSALANLHVTSERYHELAYFLHRLMPSRPLGLHYATIGFNHVGKVAIMADLREEKRRLAERLGFAAGARGTVAIGFSMPGSRYVMKVVRDRPTAGYKWGVFPGRAAVLERYRVVHEIDRAGSMLDNVIYDNVRIDTAWFTDDLCEELLTAAAETVRRDGDALLFDHLIVQMKMIPLPVYLQTATRATAEAAIVNLGTCIRNNAAANIFNRDLDARNYGVGPIGKIYLYDYDAVEPLTAVKIRTNVGRVEGEEDVPDWVFETGTVFLPEEMLTGLRIDDPHLRRHFRTVNGDLMGIDYWEGMQRALLSGLVPKVRAYPPSRRLRRDG